MSDAFTVRLDSAPVLARLAEIARKVDDLSPAMRAIGEAMTESTKQRFSDSTGPDGQRWARLAASTVLGRLAQITGGITGSYRTRGAKKGAVNKDGSLSKRSRRALENVKPLVDTGILQDTIRYQLTPGGKGVEIGTNRFAGEWDGGAAVHQFGNKKGTLPARPFLGLSEGDRGEVLAILDRFLRQAVGQ